METPAAEAPAAVAETAEVAVADEKPVTRRRRASRPAAAPEPARSESSDDVSAALDALTAEVGTTKSQTAPAAEAPADEAPVAEPVEEQRPSRRRRSSRPAATVTPFAEETSDEEAAPEMDGISAALRMAEDAARSRRALVADPFRVSAENRQAHLDDLAQSIASGDDDEDEDDDEDSEESTDDADSDDSDDSDDDSDDSDDSDDDSDDSSDDTHDAEGGGNRRRRRRGGRRRRRSGSSNREDSGASSEDSGDHSDDSAEDTDSSADADGAKSEEDTHDEDSGSDDDSDTGDGSSSGTTRRRRRRRRSGSETQDSSKSTGEDAITGIEGSTRMAAKRQRRQENRAAGRRRAPILSEAEFLARRESVDRKLVIRQGEEYTQLAVIEDNILVEHYVDRASAMSLIGNVYLGKVQNVLPSMEAAFIDIGRGRNAVLYAGEVDWTGFHVSSEDRKVEKVFKSGQAVLVQVTKDPVGAKGARLTGHISLPGRYVVYSPGGHLSGISRKLPDSERSRLREILGEVISDSESVIVRTAAEGASSEELLRDVNRLKAQWEVIEKKSKQGGAPASLYSEPDLTLRIVRDLFTEDFGALVVQGNGGADDSFDEINAYVAHVAPNLADRVQRYEPDAKGHDAFAEYRIDEQIAKALDRKVFLPSGGSLVIDRT
ncbi:MAG: ribonuclease E/G, partial [Propionibacteriaceae bacterium]|nr:ribonuclease E/G [Propionibacteriaceae bacterium]